MTAERHHVLFVCTANQQRSPTAEALYRDDPRVEVRSAGIAAVGGHPVTADDLAWADLVAVMEPFQARAIRATFPREAETVSIINLDIPDRYLYMSERLQRSLRAQFEAALQRNLAASADP